jgi:uncharacterized protein (TIGR02001 family)
MKLATALLAGAFAVAAGPALADEAAESPHTWAANIAYSTDYMYRGQSQTGNIAAVSGGFDYAYATGAFADVYLGTWASNINFGGDIEMDWYGGLTGAIGDTGFSWSAGFLYYMYPGASDASNLDFVEGNVGLAYTMADLPGSPTLGFKVHFSPEWQLNSDDSVYLDGNIKFTLPYDVGLAVHVAHQSVDDNATWGSPDWLEWNVYLSKRVIGPLDVSVGYHDTDLDKAECFGGTNICEGRFVAMVKASF